MEKLVSRKIDLKSEVLVSEETHPTPAEIVLTLGSVAMSFAQVERVPRYTETTRENDAEHSYMLALVANELAALLYPNLNTGRVTQFAIVHDLIELMTGDVATFHYSAEQMAAKQQTEHAALEALIQSLPSQTAQLLYEYEQQNTPEARFVKAVDKLLPVAVDIIGEGKKIMAEDYGVTTIDQLAVSHTKLHDRIAHQFKDFAPIVDAHGLLCELFELEFEATDHH